jgi:hypothetical protein
LRNLKMIELRNTDVTDIGVLLQLRSLEFVDLTGAAVSTSAGSSGAAVIDRLRADGVAVVY